MGCLNDTSRRHVRPIRHMITHREPSKSQEDCPCVELPPVSRKEPWLSTAGPASLGAVGTEAVFADLATTLGSGSKADRPEEGGQLASTLVSEWVLHSQAPTGRLLSPFFDIVFSSISEF